MKVPREVVLDLLPLYLCGEASTVTAAFVEECMKEDPELAAHVHHHRIEELVAGTPPAPPPELELRALRRVRRFLGLKRWLFDLGIGFMVALSSLDLSIRHGRVTGVRLFLLDYPVAFGICLVLAVGCWTGYVLIRRHLRARAF